MAGKKRTDEQLQAASDHLYYELLMFQTTANGLATGILGEGPLHDAVLESFVIHTRNLLDFLYGKKRENDKDNVIVEHFLDEPEAWVRAQPKKTELLTTVHK